MIVLPSFKIQEPCHSGIFSLRLALARRKKIDPESRLFFFFDKKQGNGIPDKITFPRSKAEKSDFSEMTRNVKGGE